jgi:DNA-binding XRE family transcriptional regulator
MKIYKTKKTLAQIKKMTVSLKEFDRRFTKKEQRKIEQEAEYLELLMNLRKTRKKIGLTHQQLAEKSNIPRATITKIENGQRNATLKTLVALGNAMGKSLQIKWV